MVGIKMARHKMSGPNFFKFRTFLRADILCKSAAGAETAAAWRIHRRRNISFEDDTLSVFFDLGIRERNCGKQRLRIRMQRIFVQFISFGKLDDDPEIHDSDAVADVADHRKVMGDEQISQPHFLLQVFQKIDDLRLNGNIQCRDRFIAYD